MYSAYTYTLRYCYDSRRKVNKQDGGYAPKQCISRLVQLVLQIAGWGTRESDLLSQLPAQLCTLRPPNQKWVTSVGRTQYIGKRRGRSYRKEKADGTRPCAGGLWRWWKRWCCSHPPRNSTGILYVSIATHTRATTPNRRFTCRNHVEINISDLRRTKL